MRLKTDPRVDAKPELGYRFSPRLADAGGGPAETLHKALDQIGLRADRHRAVCRTPRRLPFDRIERCAAGHEEAPIHTALIIDIQNDDFPGGRYELEGADIPPSVAPHPSEPGGIKHFPNGPRETDLLARLRERDVTSLVATGPIAHRCVDAPVRAAILGFDRTVAHDAGATNALTFDGRTVPARDVQAAFVAAPPYARAQDAATVVADLASRGRLKRPASCLSRRRALRP